MNRILFKEDNNIQIRNTVNDSIDHAKDIDLLKHYVNHCGTCIE